MSTDLVVCGVDGEGARVGAYSDRVIMRLPDAQNVHPELGEQEARLESERPKHPLVGVLALCHVCSP